MPKSKRSTGQKKKYRLRGKNIFLTFPQCSTSKEQVSKNLETFMVERSKHSTSPLLGAIVAQEKHADGKDHLHIALFFKERYESTNPKCFDFLTGQHGSYEVMRSVAASIEYLNKEDPSPLILGVVPSSNSTPKTTKSDTVAQMVISGSSTGEIIKQHPGYFMLNHSKILSFKSQLIACAARSTLKTPSTSIIYCGVDTTTSSIVEWLNINLFKPRAFKQPQLFLTGPPDVRKTSLVLMLSQYFHTCFAPMTEDFFDTFSDDYQLFFFDEFKGQKTVTFLNSFLQGAPFNIKIKGGQMMKMKNQPVIIASNHKLEECYVKHDNVLSLRTRLKETEITTPLDLDNIIIDPSDPRITALLEPSLTLSLAAPLSPLSVPLHSPELSPESSPYHDPEKDEYVEPLENEDDTSINPPDSPTSLRLHTSKCQKRIDECSHCAQYFAIYNKM